MISMCEREDNIWPNKKAQKSKEHITHVDKQDDDIDVSESI